MAGSYWTDVVKWAIYVGGTLVAIWSLAACGRVAGRDSRGRGRGRQVPHARTTRLDLTQEVSRFWEASRDFLTMASAWDDQLMVGGFWERERARIAAGTLPGAW